MTFWRPIHGPNRDWPLALCDAQTVNVNLDGEVSDYVTPFKSREHCVLYHRENHRWYYLSDQEIGEGLLFRQYDSGLGNGSGTPHASFMNPNGTGTEARHSVEARLVVFWD
ncbi:hypothetical protein EV356DRAFT_507472 [Viridothelium virens]|uniref:Uncharacterized protein n=1 Tax=Viridothelium virens TaxID=1048519 RepID=A0A6A6HK77_VIRVR|nr:hypothetical protein EV356DRAFT_507472 [Viridothelium virens]